MRFIIYVIFFLSYNFIYGQQINSRYEWDDQNDLEFSNQFGGAFYSIEDNPKIDSANDSDYVARFLKEGQQNSDRAGVFVDLKNKLSITNNTKLKLLVYSPSSSGVLKLKLETKVAFTYPAVLEIDRLLDLSDTWQEVEFDISAAPDNTVSRIVLFFDFGSSESSEYYFDNLIID